MPQVCALGRDDVPPLSLRGAKRRGNPYSLRQYMAESSTLGEYAATTNLPEVVPSCQVSLRGKRIAAPVCALVRNDMQKEGRVRGCKDVSPLSLRGAERRDNPFSCGSAERNAVLFGKFGKAADSPKVQLICYVSLRGRGLPHLVAPKSAMLPTGRRPAGEQRSLGAPLPAKGAPLRGPRHWFAMTCKRQRRFSECKDMAPGCYWERYLQTRTHCKLLHVIARSEATRQSASPQKCIT